METDTAQSDITLSRLDVVKHVLGWLVPDWFDMAGNRLAVLVVHGWTCFFKLRFHERSLIEVVSLPFSLGLAFDSRLRFMLGMGHRNWLRLEIYRCLVTNALTYICNLDIPADFELKGPSWLLNYGNRIRFDHSNLRLFLNDFFLFAFCGGWLFYDLLFFGRIWILVLWTLIHNFYVKSDLRLLFCVWLVFEVNLFMAVSLLFFFGKKGILNLWRLGIFSFWINDFFFRFMRRH